MSLAVVGLNHHTAPFAIREKLSLPADSIHGALSELEKQLHIQYGVILSTCNRCELYVEISDDIQAEQLIKWLCTLGGIEYTDNAKYFFQFGDIEAVRHLFEVAGSLKSEIVGEPQVLGQVKTAYQIALSDNHTNTILNKLFEYALYTAKQIRSETALGQYKTSYPSIAVEVSQKIFAKLSSRHALMIGSGDMIKATALQLKSQDIGTLTIASRSLQNAEKLALQLSADTLPFEKISESLHRFDLIVSCTASKDAIIGTKTIEQALKQRKQSPLCIVDLALPRDIESTVADIENVYLYTLENITQIVDINKHHRISNIAEAQKIIEHEIQNFMRWLNTRQVAQMITQLKAEADEQSTNVYQKSLALIEQGKDPAEALEYLKHTLTAKLMHQTIETLNKAAASGDADLIRAATRLYGKQSTEK